MSKAMEIKTYVVLQALQGVSGDRPNVKVTAVRLTKAAADAVASTTARSWIERHVATK